MLKVDEKYGNHNFQKNWTKRANANTFGTSMKLGLAVEMRPKVFSEQFTN